MSKHKYRIVGVITIILLVVMFAIVAPTYATDPIVEEEKLTCVDLAQKFGLEIDEVVDKNDTYVVYISGDGCGTKEEINNARLQIVAINGTNIENGQFVEKNKKVEFVAPIVWTTASEGAVTVKLRLEGSTPPPTNEDGTTPENQPQTGSGKEVTISYTINREASTINAVQTESNPNFNGICAIFKTGNVTNYNNNASLKSAISQSDFEKYNYVVVDARGKTFYEQTLGYCWDSVVTKGTNYTETETAAMIENVIALWKVYSAQSVSETTDFLTLFNDAKNKALSKGNSVSNPSNQGFNLKCNYNPDITTNAYGDTISETDYYKNKDYYYSSTTENTLTATYRYNYAPGYTKVETENACKRTCEESVKVEYGPPVASKAGLCFEYKVKVTSYVKCTSEVTVAEPKQTTDYCNPGPECRDVYGNVREWRPQAGPTEDFDTCVAKCDGGKYSSECSTKCYNEVYKDNIVSDLAINYTAKPATKLGVEYTNDYTIEKCLEDNKDYQGCYAKINDNITWTAVKYHQNFPESVGRWYYDRWKKSTNYYNGGYDLSGLSLEPVKPGTYIADKNGFYRRNYGSTLCNDNCTWLKTCADDDYLNPGSAAVDYKENMAEYQRITRACLGSATCSTKTAEFTIAIKYDTEDANGNYTVNKVYFPYSSSIKKNPTENANEYDSVNKDELKAQGNNTLSSLSSIISYDGCYKDKNIGNRYMTEWSFPGTYIHNKTGEISFAVPNDTSGWYYEDRKFCMPLDAKSVNTKWWEWYKLGNKCYTAADIENELKGKDGTSNGYNIEAIVENFGYYGWNFNVKCFYALKNEICNINENGCCYDMSTIPGGDIPTSNGTANYTIRTVDRDNLFPNSVSSGVVDATTRDIGFNWTSKASILELKNPNYQVNPEKLIQEIQDNADSLYTDENNLDYQFYLTPETLRKIKKYNDKYDFGVWNGTSIEKNGIMAYSSNLFRSTGLEPNIIGTDSVKEVGEIGVNNQYN